MLHAKEWRRLACREQDAQRVYNTIDQGDHWAALAAIFDDLSAYEIFEGEQLKEVLAHWLR